MVSGRRHFVRDPVTIGILGVAFMCAASLVTSVACNNLPESTFQETVCKSPRIIIR